MDGLGGILGDLGRALGWSWRDLGRSWAVLEGSWAIFGGLLGGLGGILAGLGRILDDLERYFGRSWEDHRFLLVGGSIFGTRQAIVHKNMQLLGLKGLPPFRKITLGGRHTWWVPARGSEWLKWKFEKLRGSFVLP